MKRYNPILQMKYNTRTNKLSMTPETFLTYVQFMQSPEICDKAKKTMQTAFEFLIRKED